MDRRDKYCPYCMSRLSEEGPCPSCGLTSGTYMPMPHHLPPGTVLMDRYLVGRVLGEGGFGITYIGCDLKLELKVAIKEYFPTTWVSRHADVSQEVHCYAGAQGNYDKGRRRFLYEARTMAKMDKQPEIVSVRDFFEANNTVYIVMEYIDGTTFKELVTQRGGRIPAGELLHMIEPLFSALGAMHSAGLIHRDISPDNLMLERGAVRLLDFGCARESAQGDETMTITLKHGYAPIEQYQHKGQGPWTDVYGLSATIYYCLTGKTPPQALDRLLDDDLIRPRSLGVDLTEKQERALLRGMGIKQHQRFQNVEELHTALYEGVFPLAEDGGAPEQTQDLDTGAEKQEEPDAAAETGADAPRGGKKPARRLYLGLAAAAAALLILALALIPRGGEDVTVPSALPTAAGTAPAQTPEAEALPDFDSLFANAVTAGPEDILTLLENGSVGAISISDDCFIGGSTVIDKPVHIPEGASLDIRNIITLGENAVLWVEGAVTGMDGALIAGEGRLVAAAGCDIGAAVCLQEGRLLAGPDGELGALNGSVYTIPALPADAVSVSNIDELSQALAMGSPVLVEGDIELTSDVEARSAVYVAGGASLSGEGKLLMNGAPFVNRGTVGCNVWLGWGEDAVFVNEGSVSSAEVWLDEGAGFAVNRGELLPTGQVVLFRDFINFGSVSLDAEGSAVTSDGALTINAGTIDVQQGAYEPMGPVFNCGTLRVAGYMNNSNYLTNDGELRVAAGGHLDNLGVIDMYDGSPLLAVEEGAELNSYAGVILHRDQTVIEGRIEGPVWGVDFSLIDGDAERAYVGSEEELLAALADPAVECVVINGGVRFTQPRTFTKTVYIEGGGSLLVPSGMSLTVDGTVLCVNGVLYCDDLTVRSGGMAEFLCDWRGMGDGGRLTLEDGSWAYTRHSSLSFTEVSLGQGSMLVYNNGSSISLRSAEISGGTLAIAGDGAELQQLTADISSGGRMINVAPVNVAAGELSIAGGSLMFMNDDFALDAGRLEVDAESTLVLRPRLALGAEAVLENRGVVSVEGYVHCTEIAGVLENYGELRLGMPVVVRGGLVNEGTIVTNDRSWSIRLEGGELSGSGGFRPFE